VYSGQPQGLPLRGFGDGDIAATKKGRVSVKMGERLS